MCNDAKWKLKRMGEMMIFRRDRFWMWFALSAVWFPVHLAHAALMIQSPAKPYTTGNPQTAAQTATATQNANAALAQYQAGHPSAGQGGAGQDKSQTSAPAAPPSASDQGLSKEEIGRINGIASPANNEDMSSARQQGVKEVVPEITDAVVNDPASSRWLSDWFHLLESYGTPEKRYRFEAGRLSRYDFDAWANRRILWAKKQLKGDSAGVRE